MTLGNVTVSAPSHRVATAAWTAWTTRMQVTVTDPDALDRARTIVERHLAAVAAAASRFAPGSEVCRLAADPGGRATVGPLLAELVAAALAAAAATDGAVDPTLGAELVALGYDRDLPVVRAAPAGATDGTPVQVRRTTDWRHVVLTGRTLTVPPGTLLDLGATAKAWTADRAAEEAATAVGCGVLVSLGGDVRVAGPPPDGGWVVRVSDGPDEPVSDVRLVGLEAVATSSTLHRTWRTGARRWHHILDPRSGRSTPDTWRTVSVAAPTCLAANTLSTMAVVRGADALNPLRGSGFPVRLVAADGTVTTLNGWPT